jgi:UDP-N-acetylglucosamine 4,6-dehydratase
MFKDKTLLITGGTGSFGNEILKGFLDTDIAEIRIFSRDEKKQDDQRKIYDSDKLNFFLGDVRDYRSLLNATKDVDFIFHAAALKQVPSCEFYPMEAVKTNIIGTENVLQASFENNVKKVICLSTDKAVYPINAMGMSKAMMEKVMVSKSRVFKNSNLSVCGTRYGNVMGSRGSVIPLFINQILNKVPLTVTDLNMTRFMMSLEEAVNLVLYAFKNGENGDIFVQKSPSATLETLIDALKINFSIPNYPVNVIGTRHGEKLYEVLLSREEMAKAKDLGNYYQISSDKRDLNYEKYIERGDNKLSETDDFNSHNCKLLTAEELAEELIKLDFVKEALSIFRN